MNNYCVFKGKKIPYEIPEIQTYPYFTGIIGILLANNKGNTWIYNNYILIWVMRNMYNIDYWIDFKYGNEEVHREFCSMLDKTIITREEISNKYKNLREAITDFIEKQQYAFISVDVYYISNWVQMGQSRKHFRHQMLILGYDSENDKILLADFVEEKYNTIITSFEEFEKGYMNFDSYKPYEEFGEDIWLLSINENKEELNLDRVLMLMEDFLSSSDNHLINHIQLENKEHKYVFGLDAINEIGKYCMYTLNTKQMHIDIRPFHILVELQKVMYKRLKYIENIYSKVWGAKGVELYEKLKILMKDSQKLQSMAIKYNFTQRSNILIKMKQILDELVNNEKVFLESCIWVLKK